MRAFGVILVHLFVALACAQYPRTRLFDLRQGGERPDARHLLVDRQGSLWVAGRTGLFHTDGAHTRRVVPADSGEVTAVGPFGASIAVALSNGTLLRVTGSEAELIHHDTVLRGDHVRALAGGDDGVLWVGTRSGGLWRIGVRGVSRIGVEQGLPDDHVNDLLLLNDRLLVATDAGIAWLDPDGRLTGTLGESDGAPDNLVLALGTDEQGRVWAGTDRGPCFRLSHGPSRLEVDTILAAPFGPVVALACSDGKLWTATPEGVRLYDLAEGAGLYLPPGDRGTMPSITAIAAAPDGGVWWCGGGSRLFRGDGRVLIVPGHEGVDLREVSALCLDHTGRVHLAVGNVIHGHSNAFAERERMTHIPLPMASQVRIAALHADAQGAIWVGTMGHGLYRIKAGLPVTHWTERDGLANDHVLGIGSDGIHTWLATLGGVGVVRSVDGVDRLESPRVPGSGFLYAVLPDGVGGVHAASDGNGLIHLDAAGKATVIPAGPDGGGTLHTLTRDTQGRLWAGGPGIGLLKLDGERLVKMPSPGPVAEEVNGIAPLPRAMLVFAKGSVWLADPDQGSWLDIAPLLGPEERPVSLTALDRDEHGEVWAATDLGVLRLGPGLESLLEPVPAMILGWRSGEDPLPASTDGGGPELPHDRNHLTFLLAAPALGMPEAIRFEYRLLGHDTALRITREREVSFARLPPGRYRFEVRAALEGVKASGPWTTLGFRILAPWWRRAWAMALWVLLLSLGLFAFVRAREKRMRLRDQLEQEKVKYQLDALRSQVNPHFLFNSFNVLIELIEQDREKAVEQVQDLSAFFRDMLRVRDQELIAVREELRLVRHYFALEQRRFGPRIHLDVQVDGAVLDRAIPPLTLQLLVENAIKHNVATDAEPLTITIRAEEEMLVVTNPLRPRAQAPASTGFGLDSIRKRCLALSGRPAIVREVDGRFEVRIPLMEP